MIPGEKKGGKVFKFFFMVYPFHKPASEQYTGYDPREFGARFVDTMSFGFSFNRRIKHDYFFDVDIFHFHDINIF